MNYHNNSPFVDSEPMTATNQEAAAETVSEVFINEANSPFLSVFESPGQEDRVSPKQEAFVSLVDELFDEELEETLEDLAHEAEVWYENRRGGMSGSDFSTEFLTQQLMSEHYAPLLNEVERFLEHSEKIGRQHDEGKLSELAFETAIDQYQSLQQFEAPEFDQFLGKIKNAVKKVAGIAKKGISLAAKIGLGPVINKLKGYVMSFLKGFLQKAMKKVPASLRPYAEKLQAKYIGKPKENSAETVEVPNQQELNIAIAEMLMTPNQQEMDAELEAFMRETDMNRHDDTRQMLYVARERLGKQLGDLQEGESPEPAVEEFVTTILTGLKWAIKIIGRGKVKNFLVQQLTKITSKLIDKKNAEQLSKLIVDQGFSMLSLEVGHTVFPDVGHEAVVTTLEDSLLQIAQLPDHILSNEVLLEGYILEAFEQSAKVNLPDMLSENTYQQNPDLRESNRRKLFWLKKLQKRGKKHFYKKLSQELDAELSPYILQEIKTHEGIPLSAFLRDSMGVNTRDNVLVRIKMFELLPGGTLYDIARNEITKHFDYPDRFLTKQFHPLTSVAAGLLLGEPKLGCRGKGKCLAGRKSGQYGHRYYYLDIPQATPQLFTRQDGSQALRRPSQIRLKLNFIKRNLEVVLFFSEADAQVITVLLRKNQMGRAQHTAISVLKTGLTTAFKYPGNSHLMVVHPMVMPGPGSGMAFQSVPPVVQHALRERIEEWITLQLADYLKNNFHAFIEASIHEADGLTMRFNVVAPEGFDLLYDYIGGKQAGLSTRLFAQAAPETSISLQTDYSYE